MVQYIIRNAKLIIEEIVKNIWKALLSSFGIILLIAFLVLYLSLRDSVTNFVEKRLFGSLDINEIIIEPKAKTGEATLSYAINSIPAEKVKAIRKMNNVASVYTVTCINAATKIKIELLGKSRAPYVPICGISQQFIKDKVPGYKSFRYYPNEPVPVIAPQVALDMFNNFAAINNLPFFNEETLKGFPLTLIIDTPKSIEVKKHLEIPAVVHSFSSLFNLTGIVVPDTFVNKIAAQYAAETKSAQPILYIRLYAKVKDVKKLPEVTKQIKSMGLAVTSLDEVASKTNQAMSIIDGFSIFVGFFLLLLTVISIFNSYLIIIYNRSYSFSLRRILGVSKFRIIMTFMVEAAFIGAVYGFIGYLAGAYLIEAAGAKLSSLLPALSGIGLEPVGMNVCAGLVLFSIAISSLSALIPAIFASNMNLFKALSKQ